MIIFEFLMLGAVKVKCSEVFRIHTHTAVPDVPSVVNAVIQ